MFKKIDKLILKAISQFYVFIIKKICIYCIFYGFLSIDCSFKIFQFYWLIAFLMLIYQPFSKHQDDICTYCIFYGFVSIDCAFKIFLWINLDSINIIRLCNRDEW